MKATLTDIQIAQKAKPVQIFEVARRFGIMSDEIEPYGQHKAKVSLRLLDRLGNRPNGKLVMISAMTPTASGEGKTSTAIGLTQALGRLKKNACLCLREPSMGPVFGQKGGACGSGYAQVLPMEDINLHFTGDVYAVGAAHNLLAALIDNHITKGNRLKINPNRIVWPRVIDINDRSLRHITTRLVGKKGAVMRKTGFYITAASEVMAILSLATSIADLKERLSRIIIGYTFNEKPVTANDLKAVGSMALLLKDAIKPNLVQTLEGQPVFMHTGPFANIAHGNNSIISLKMALKLADYVVTESGFGSDLGAEKFFDIVCRQFGLKTDAVVLVVSIRALKNHGGVRIEKTNAENLKATEKGLANLARHIENIKKFGLWPVVAINRFPLDTESEIKIVLDYCQKQNVKAVISQVVSCGGSGGIALAEVVLKVMQEHPSQFRPLYELGLPVKEKIKTIATQLYGASVVAYSSRANRDILRLTKLGFDKLPINMARTQLSFTDDPRIKGAPKGWNLKVREVGISAGAGFLVPITGQMLLLPGLPEHPAAEHMDITDDAKITGLS